jgi:hypothetical protein
LLRPGVTIKSLPAPAETTGRSKERVRWSVTVTEPRGEPIARIAVVLNDEDFEWRENPKRVVRSCACGPSGRGGLSELDVDRDSGVPCCGGKRYRRGGKHERGEREGSRSRRPADGPRREEAQGSIRIGATLICRAVQGTLGRVKARKSRPVVPAGAALGWCRRNGGLTASGSTARRNGLGYLSRGEGFEGCQKSQERCRHETRSARRRGA